MFKALALGILAGLTLLAAPASGLADTNGLMIVRHQVSDYAKWRQVFDGQDAVRDAAGLTNPRVYQIAGNSNEVLIVIDAADLEQARSFASSPELKARMKDAGVVGKPEILFLTVGP
ncbi:MAG: cyclase [Bauldia sp.]|nr:cyclase [Bauldia sp.]